MAELLTEAERRQYIDTFVETMEPLIIKDIIKNKSNRTRFKIKESSSQNTYGIKKEFELKHKKKQLTFSVEYKPWLWSDASIAVEFDVIDSRNLVIPKRKIGKGAVYHSVWKPTDSKFWYVKNLEPVGKYLKALELTPMDVSLFDNLEQVAKNLFK